MSPARRLVAIVLLAMAWAGCSCDPLIGPPDSGFAGGSAGGRAGGAGGGAAGGAMAGGMGGGAMAGGMGGGMSGGAGGGGGGSGGGAVTQFTEYVRALIVTGTSDTAAPRPEAEWAGLPDDAPITYSPAFFDGGTN